jgi:hypothetical protein
MLKLTELLKIEKKLTNKSKFQHLTLTLIQIIPLKKRELNISSKAFVDTTKIYLFFTRLLNNLIVSSLNSSSKLPPILLLHKKSSKKLRTGIDMFTIIVKE